MPRLSLQQALALEFLNVGCAMIKIPVGRSQRSRAAKFRHNFKWGPGRLAYLYSKIHLNPILPRGSTGRYEVKHLLWTFYFLYDNGVERRRCYPMKTDRKTIRKYAWPTVYVIASLARSFVSTAVL
jgi:hypothetical protein